MTRKSATKTTSNDSKQAAKQESSINQNLAHQLKELWLPSFREHNQDVAQRANQESLSYEQCLWELVSQIEDMKYKTLPRCLNAFAMLAVVAWRVEYLKHAARMDPAAPC